LAEHAGTYEERLVKIWPLRDQSPLSIERALWDVELRRLLQLSSLPGAADYLTTLSESSADKLHGQLVMVVESAGYLPLSHALQDRRDSLPWLSPRQREVRSELWKGLLRVARGLALLHRQQILHRALSEEVVFCNPSEGPQSFRLGGFEWSLSLRNFRGGQRPEQPAAPALNDSGPLSAAQFSFAADWQKYGRLCGRLILGGAASSSKEPWALLPFDAAAQRLESAQWLHTSERNLIKRLLDPNPETRLAGLDMVLPQIRQVVEELEGPLSGNEYLALVVFIDSTARRDERDNLAVVVREKLLESPVEPPPGKRKELYWIEQDLRDARLLRKSDPNNPAMPPEYLLVGRKLIYKLEPERQDDGLGAQWKLARCRKTYPFRQGDHTVQSIALRRSLRVYHPADLKDFRAKVLSGAFSWDKQWLEAQQTLPDRLRYFHDFLRLTNQIDLLMRDAEIFAYERIAEGIAEGIEQAPLDNTVFIAIAERDRDLGPPEWARRGRSEGTNLIAFLEELSKDQEDVLVHLGTEESLELPQGRRELFERVCWQVVNNPQRDCPELFARVGRGSVVFLSRQPLSPPEKEQCPPQEGDDYGPAAGFLRSPELYGQIRLVRRRKQAIDQLAEHDYLLRLLSRPIHMDLGEAAETEGPDLQQFDEAKQQALRAVWRTRPLFALQGPPGTGKTYFVAKLLAKVFAEDPLAQVLVTAQAHTAVDVLRDRVRAEIAKNEPADPPLFLRARVRPNRQNMGASPNPQEQSDRDYVWSLARQLLERAKTQLQAVVSPSEVQIKWRETVNSLLHDLQRGSQGITDFVELVRRSANITFATSTSSDLAELSQIDQRFDWVIVEEAGRAHGFELVLPLMLGFRFLLIGDQNQLEPYRFHDYRRAIEQLPSVLERLQTLAARPRTRDQQLLDSALVSYYLGSGRLRSEPDKPTEVEQLQKTAELYLKFFSRVYEACTEESQEAKQRHADSLPIAAMLTHQHRMHPVLGSLISTAYYKGELKNATVSGGQPTARVRHAFVEPAGIADRSLVFVDVPRRPRSGSEAPARDGLGFATAPDEIEAITNFLAELREDPARARLLFPKKEQLRLAVLTPYRKQAKELSIALRRFFDRGTPEWLKPSQADRGKPKFVHTVDSFQGDQADVVMVSLVRNNLEVRPKLGLGFLADDTRTNVLLSRAERLLVLVGCWEFFQDMVRRAEGTVVPWAPVMRYLGQHALRIPAQTLRPLAPGRPR